MNRSTYMEIIKQCDKVLTDDKRKVWATRLKNSQKGNVVRYLITDFRAFRLLTGIVRYYSTRRKTNERIFYRGQSNEWPLKPKIYRGCEPKNCNINKEVELAKEKMILANEWKKAAMDLILAEQFDFNGTLDEREAMAQHYGMSTSFIDIVDHIQTALWFAYNTLDANASAGYVYVISVPTYKATIIDLRNKPSIWLRPQVQQAYCFKMNKITEFGKIPERYHIMTFVVPRELLRIWSNYDVIGEDYMFPTADTDKGLYHWRKAECRLVNSGIEISPEKWIEQKLAEKGLI